MFCAYVYFFMDCNKPNFASRKKVELHVHLDGAIRTSTAWELAQKKQIAIPGINSFIEFEQACRVSQPTNLRSFIDKFGLFWPPLLGDLDAYERIAYEFCEDEYYAGVIYAEVRYSPRLAIGKQYVDQYGEQILDEVIRRVSHGLCRGYYDFGVMTRQILCGRYKPDFSDLWETLKLCQKHYDKGVVGIDLLTVQPPQGILDEAQIVEPTISVFREAANTCIHRTMHAGECSGPGAVERAIYYLGSERIGHGYHVLQDPALYQRCLQDQVHFECCPYSSMMTGSANVWGSDHPICRFARDGANFSISADDPIVTGHTVQKDHELLAAWGVPSQVLDRAQVNGCYSSFLSENEKKVLLRQLRLG